MPRSSVDRLSSPKFSNATAAATTQHFTQYPQSDCRSEEELRPAETKQLDSQPGKPLIVNTELNLHRASLLRARARRLLRPWLKANTLSEAERLYRKCARISPRDYRGFLGLGLCLKERSMLHEAEQALADGCVATQGDVASLWEARGSIMLRMSCEPGEARAMFDAALAADRRNVSAWRGLAECEKRRGDMQRAAALARRGARVAGAAADTTSLWLFVGRIERNVGNFENARDALRRGTGSVGGSQNAPLLRMSATLEWRAGDRGLASSLLRRALRASPRSSSVMLTWALWESELGAHSCAESVLRTARKRERRNPALVQALGRVLGRQKKYEEAQQELEAWLNCFGDDTCILHAYAWILAAKNGSTDRAREMIKRGVQAEPEMKKAAPLYASWASLEASEQNVTAARKLLRSCVECDPISDAGWDRWIRMERQLGNQAGAQRLQQLKLDRRIEVQQTGNPPESVLWPLADPLATFIENSRNSVSGEKLPNAPEESAVTSAGSSTDESSLEELYED